MIFPFESYSPKGIPQMSGEEAREIAKDILVGLVEAVFQKVTAEEVITNSDYAFKLNADEQARVAALMNAATVEIVASW